MDNLVVVLVILTSVAVLIQVALAVGLLVYARKTTRKLEVVEGVVENNLKPMLSEFRTVLGQTSEILTSVRGMTEKLDGVAESVRSQVERVSEVIGDTTERARYQISRADAVVTDAIQKMEATSEVVQQNVLAPIREVSAVIRGVSSGLHYLFSPKRNTVDQVHQDEEMFI
ncbi:MAG: hypothetical protein AB1898_17545 [Acidobacteriota bacterium]